MYTVSGAQTRGLWSNHVGVGYQEVLHTLSGHSKLHPSVICPVNKDNLTLMSSPILDPVTTEMTEERVLLRKWGRGSVSGWHTLGGEIPARESSVTEA